MSCKYCSDTECENVVYGITFIDNAGERIIYEDLYDDLEQLQEFADKHLEDIGEYVGYTYSMFYSNCLSIV